jgi:hypothetical protein
MDDILFGDKTDKPNVKKSKIKMHINDLRVQANIDAYKREEIKYKNYYRNMLETCVNEIETKGHEALVNNRAIAEHMAELYLKVIIINIIIHLRGYKNNEKDTDLIYYKPEDILKIIQQLIGFYEFNDFPITQSLVEFFSGEVEGKTSLVTETPTTSLEPYSPPLHPKTQGISWFGKLNVFALQSTFYIPFMHTNQLEHKLKHSTIVSYNDVYDAKLLRKIFLSTLNKGKFNETSYIDYKNMQEKLLEKIPNAKNTHLWPDSLYTLLNLNVKEDGIVLITPLIYFSVELTNRTFANKLYICGGSFSKSINVHGNEYDSYLFMLHDLVHLYVYKQFCLPNVTENIRKFYYYYNDVIKRMTGKTEADKKLIKEAVSLFFFIITHETGPAPDPVHNKLCLDIFSCDQYVLSGEEQDIINNPFYKNLDNLFNVQLDVIKKFYNGDLPIPTAYKSDRLDEKVYTYLVLCCNLFFNFFIAFCTEGGTMMPYFPKDLNILESDYHAKVEDIKENPNPTDIELIQLYNAYTSKVVAEQISKQIAAFVPGRQSQQVPEELVIDFESENIINNLEHFSELKKLTVNKIEDYQMEDIASKLEKLSKLKELIIKDSNALISLPESIGTNESLQKIVIKGNKSLRSIPESIGTKGQLEILIVENNNALTSVPASIGNIKTVSNRNNKSLVGGGGKKRSKKRKNVRSNKKKRMRKGTRRNTRKR